MTTKSLIPSENIRVPATQSVESLLLLNLIGRIYNNPGYILSAIDVQALLNDPHSWLSRLRKQCQFIIEVDFIKLFWQALLTASFLLLQEGKLDPEQVERVFNEVPNTVKSPMRRVPEDAEETTITHQSQTERTHAIASLHRSLAQLLSRDIASMSLPVLVAHYQEVIDTAYQLVAAELGPTITLSGGVHLTVPPAALLTPPSILDVLSYFASLDVPTLADEVAEVTPPPTEEEVVYEALEADTDEPRDTVLSSDTSADIDEPVDTKTQAQRVDAVPDRVETAGFKVAPEAEAQDLYTASPASQSSVSVGIPVEMSVQPTKDAAEVSEPASVVQNDAIESVTTDAVQATAVRTDSDKSARRTISRDALQSVLFGQPASSYASIMQMIFAASMQDNILKANRVTLSLHQHREFASSVQDTISRVTQSQPALFAHLGQGVQMLSRDEILYKLGLKPSGVSLGQSVFLAPPKEQPSSSLEVRIVSGHPFSF